MFSENKDDTARSSGMNELLLHVNACVCVAGMTRTAAALHVYPFSISFYGI